MSVGKRKSDCSLSDSSGELCSAKKQMLLAKSVDKWINEYDKDYNTVTWLKYDVDRDQVESLKVG